MYFVIAELRKGGKEKPTTDDLLPFKQQHVYHHEEDDMVAHPKTRRPHIFNHRSTSNALPERRIWEKTKDAPAIAYKLLLKK